MNSATLFAFLRKENKTTFFANLFGDSFFDILIESRKNVHLHELMDQLKGFEIQPCCQVAHLDGRLHLNDF